MANRGVKNGLEGKMRNTDLVKARETLGLTQREAAKKIGISKESLGNYEILKTYPSYETQKKICRFYNQNGYCLKTEDMFPEYMEVVAVKHGGKGNGIPKELIIPLSSVKDSYRMNVDKFDAECLLDKLLPDIHPRYRDIIIARFGLYGEPKQTFEEVGRKYRITRERVRQLELKAIQGLRKKLRKEKAVL